MRNRILALLAFTVLAISARAAQPLVIHEWGTFTALQDENGVALGRINTDDEPVPEFVHTISRYILEQGHPLALGFGRELSPQSLSMLRYSTKGFPSRHPLVTLRLETPVLYFYPPADDPKPFNVDVKASFKGGWLTEFYPKAIPTAPGMQTNGAWSNEIPITSETVGSLEWKTLTINASSLLPKTDWHVWLAPRNTAAAQLVASNGESEKYLFYRGVGNRRAPVSVRDDTISGRLVVERLGDGSNLQQRVPALWLLDVRADGRSAWRAVEGRVNQSDRIVADLRNDFDEGDYRVNSVESLRAQMHLALVKDGLFADEATAMLSTWQRAYFESFGKRLFFVVPREWTDAVLPLEISVPAQVTRSMIGRIELIGESQRALLKQLRETPTSDPRWLMKVPYDDSTKKFLSRQTPFGEMQLPAETPADYKLYMQLGRFRSALVLNEQEKNPSPQLAEFIKRYGIDSPMAVIDQIIHERPAADALLNARAAVQKDFVEGYKALHAVVAEFGYTAAGRAANRDIAELWQDLGKRPKLDAVRPACLLLLLQKTKASLCADTLFDRYPNSPEAKEARATLERWAREEAEQLKEAIERQRAAEAKNN